MRKYSRTRWNMKFITIHESLIVAAAAAVVVQAHQLDIYLSLCGTGSSSSGSCMEHGGNHSFRCCFCLSSAAADGLPVLCGV